MTKQRINLNKVEGPQIIEAECKKYTIFIGRRIYLLYQYNTGQYMDFVVRNAGGRIVERHTSEYIEVSRAFTDSSE